MVDRNQGDFTLEISITQNYFLKGFCFKLENSL